MSNRAKALAARIAALGLQQKRIAAIAQLDEATVSQALSGRRNSYTSTLDAIERAIQSEEDRLRQLLAPTSPEAA